MLTGLSILGFEGGRSDGAKFTGVNPATGEKLEPLYASAGLDDVDRAARLAEKAFATYASLPARSRALFLRRIADGLDAISAELVERAHLETALPKPRLQGEVTRTSNQMRLFADVVDDGSWQMARIDLADAQRKPLPKPDIRSMLRPLGPVVVFGASNFPLAFSVAGGDTASALAAGNPVIVKAHPAHPGTSELAGQVIRDSVRASGLPEGVFSLLFDAGVEIGTALVKHPLVKAVGFTGSLAAGRALMDLAAARPEPIPCFAEMSSTNPVFILPGALDERADSIAEGLFASFTLGAGQFCTKPGLVFLPQHDKTAGFLTDLRRRAQSSPAFTMLTAGIAKHYHQGLEERAAKTGLPSMRETAKTSTGSCATQAAIFETDVATLLSDPALSEEIFGPATVVVRHQQREEILQAAESLRGHLTATIIGTERDIESYGDLIAILERKVGRLLFNGYPTGVEVCHAMVHGGPYPATSDGRSTSVGSQAIFRFARPVCYQNFPDAVLPDELKNANPLNVWRMVNGSLTRESVAGSQI
jgi:alpha-ketoglutaric semialdehyde dehydrogenase